MAAQRAASSAVRAFWQMAGVIDPWTRTALPRPRSHHRPRPFFYMDWLLRYQNYDQVALDWQHNGGVSFERMTPS